MGEVGGINAEAGQFPEGWLAPAEDDSETPRELMICGDIIAILMRTF